VGSETWISTREVFVLKEEEDDEAEIKGEDDDGEEEADIKGEEEDRET
jgi:hypothetical protein